MPTTDPKSPFLVEVARQMIENLWTDIDDASFAHRLTPEQGQVVLGIIARGLPRPGDGSDQPTIPVNDDGWGHPIPQGSKQPTLW